MSSPPLHSHANLPQFPQQHSPIPTSLPVNPHAKSVISSNTSTIDSDTANTPNGAAEPHTDGRSRTSAQNGRKSRGPKSPEGKAKISQNAVTHGLTSKDPVLATEERRPYLRVKAEYLALYKPTNIHERDIIEHIADAS
ncbi:MAG: hypothetical protein JNK87_17175, partial [Bryobacterales bacterium]|nr:hypothetical protein [Bryobacterales bacterium]